MRYSIHECSTLTAFENIEKGQLFIRNEDKNTLYLKGGDLRECYINLETGKVVSADIYNSNGVPDLVFPITDYELTVYLSKEV